MLDLYRVPGEASGEFVLFRSWRTYTFWVKHEYVGRAATATEPAIAPAPWEWIIVDGNVPLACGTEDNQADAEKRLAAAVAEFCPSFDRRANSPDYPPGLLRRLWRAI